MHGDLSLGYEALPLFGCDVVTFDSLALLIVRSVVATPTVVRSVVLRSRFDN